LRNLTDGTGWLVDIAELTDLTKLPAAAVRSILSIVHWLLGVRSKVDLQALLYLAAHVHVRHLAGLPAGGC
jgi:hypothetical protein